MYDPFDVKNYIKQANYNNHEGAIKQYDSFNDGKLVISHTI